MAAPIGYGKRNSPFTRNSMSSSPLSPRPLSIVSQPSRSPQVLDAPRSSSNQSHLSSDSNGTNMVPKDRTHLKSASNVSTSTFAPKFIELEEQQRDTERVRGIEGENDFSGKHYVWLKDTQHAFVKGWVVENRPENKLLVQCDDGTVSFRVLGSFHSLTDFNSNARLMLIQWTRLILESLTRRTIWQNSRISMRHLSFTIYTFVIKAI